MSADTPEGRQVAWERLRPELDGVIGKLGEKDRIALVLRFYEGKSYREVGAALGLSEDGARSRLERALETLRSRLMRAGITSSAALIGEALAAQAAEVAVPAGFAAQVATAAAGGGGAGAAAAFGAILAMNKIQVGMVAAALALSVAPAVVEVRAHRALQSEAERVEGLQTEANRLQELGESDLARLENGGATAGPEMRELARVRRQIALVNARPAWVDESRRKPIGSARNEGWKSAQAAYETLMWAEANGDAKVWQDSFRWEGDAKGQADAAFERLSPALQAQYGNADRFAGAALFAAASKATDPLVAFQAEVDPEAAYARAGILLRVTAWNYRANGDEGIGRIDLYYDGQAWAPGETRFPEAQWNQWVSALGAQR